MQATIRDADLDELSALGELALRAKAHWGYDRAFIEACRAELTFTKERARRERLRVAEIERRVVGFSALLCAGQQAELTALFVEPELIGGGVGQLLFEDAVREARQRGARRLAIEADPHAAAWYEARGAKRVGEVASGSIPGRVIPELVLELETSARDWQAETYHRVSEPQRAWGEKVLGALALRGDETVLDAGCGTGRLTLRLAERLPRGRVVALDASPAMLEVAQRELARFGDRVSFVRASLGRDALPAGMDVVFSTATFHWVLDHDALFRSIAAALVPGGRLHAQCGGAGNLDRAHARVHEVVQRPLYRSHFAGMADPWLFADVQATERRLSASGFSKIDVWLEDAPTPFADAASYAEFVGSVVLRPYLGRLPEPLHAGFVADVTELAERDTPALTLDYVRLNLRAVV